MFGEILVFVHGALTSSREGHGLGLLSPRA